MDEKTILFEIGFILCFRIIITMFVNCLFGHVGYVSSLIYVSASLAFFLVSYIIIIIFILIILIMNYYCSFQYLNKYNMFMGLCHLSRTLTKQFLKRANCNLTIIIKEFYNLSTY